MGLDESSRKRKFWRAGKGGQAKTGAGGKSKKNNRDSMKGVWWDSLNKTGSLLKGRISVRNTSRTDRRIGFRKTLSQLARLLFGVTTIR